MADLLRQASVTPSSSSSSEEDELDPSQKSKRTQSGANSKGKKKKKSNHPYDTLAGNLAVLVVACWMMRLPLRYLDFIRSAQNLILKSVLAFLTPWMLSFAFTSEPLKHTCYHTWIPWDYFPAVCCGISKSIQCNRYPRMYVIDRYWSFYVILNGV